MRKWVFIILTLFLLGVTCKAISSPINDKYELCIQLDEMIEEIRTEIQDNKDDECMFKIYFKILRLKYEFLESRKDKSTRDYYERSLNKFNVYIGNTICERDVRWLDEAKLLLIDTFGDYENHNMKYMR